MSRQRVLAWLFACAIVSIVLAAVMHVLLKDGAQYSIAMPVIGAVIAFGGSFGTVVLYGVVLPWFYDRGREGLERVHFIRDSEGEKKCPMCAETVKAAAVICKHCSHRFS